MTDIFVASHVHVDLIPRPPWKVMEFVSRKSQHVGHVVGANKRLLPANKMQKYLRCYDEFCTPNIHVDSHRVLDMTSALSLESFMHSTELLREKHLPMVTFLPGISAGSGKTLPSVNLSSKAAAMRLPDVACSPWQGRTHSTSSCPSVLRWTLLVFCRTRRGTVVYEILICALRGPPSGTKKI